MLEFCWDVVIGKITGCLNKKMVVYQQKTVYLNIAAKNETDQKCWFLNWWL